VPSCCHLLTQFQDHSSTVGCVDRTRTVHHGQRDLPPAQFAHRAPGGEHVATADEVAAEDEPAGGIDEYLALLGPALVAELADVGHHTFFDEVGGVAHGDKAHLAHGDHQLGHEGVVDFGDADVLGPYSGHGIGPFGRQTVALDARQVHQVVAAPTYGVGLVGRTHALDPHGLLSGTLADLDGPLLAGEDESAGAFGVHAGFQQAQERSDDPAGLLDLLGRDDLVAPLAEGVAVALAAEHLDHLRTHVDLADVVRVLVVVGQALEHVGVRRRRPEGVLEERIPALGDGVDHHGRGRATLWVVAVGGLLATHAHHDVRCATRHFHPGRAHGVEAGSATVGDAHAGLHAHADQAGQGRLGNGHVLEHVVVDPVHHGVHFLGGHAGVLEGSLHSHPEELPVGGLHPPGAAFRDCRSYDRDSSHPNLPFWAISFSHLSVLLCP